MFEYEAKTRPRASSIPSENIGGDGFQSFPGQTPLGHPEAKTCWQTNLVLHKKVVISQLTLLNLTLDFHA